MLFCFILFFLINISKKTNFPVFGIGILVPIVIFSVLSCFSSRARFAVFLPVFMTIRMLSYSISGFVLINTILKSIIIINAKTKYSKTYKEN